MTLVNYTMIQRAWNEPILGKLYPLFPQPWLWWGVSSKSDLLQRSKHWWFGCKGQASSFTIDIRPSTAAQVLNTLSMRGVLTKAPGHSKSEGMWSSSPCESAQNVPKGWNWDPKKWYVWSFKLYHCTWRDPTACYVYCCSINDNGTEVAGDVCLNDW